MGKLQNVWFLILLGLVFGVGVLTFVKSETLTSKAENRNLSTFQHFTLDGFMSGEFQDGFEAALSDQFVGSEQIRTTYGQVVSHLPNFGIEENICHRHYLELESADERKRGVFDCEDYILYLPEPMTNEQDNIVKENIEKYNHLNRLGEVYYYFVDDPSSFNFEKNVRVVDYPEILTDGLSGQAGMDRLKYEDYDGYKGYFYKTDHHWDYRGSYQGFLDVAKMLGIDNPMQPKGIFTNHENFFGSYAKNTNNYDSLEEFQFYEFDIPKHETWVNGKKERYSHFNEYKNHEYIYDKMSNYYAYVYGDDFAEVIFDFHRPEKKNLLIISNSYSNAINELVAQYFDKTYVVDLRHYKEFYNKDFNPSEYMRANKIDEVLVLMSPTFIRATEPNRGLEL